MLILGIDPGLAVTGYGVLREDKGRLEVLESGAIRTDSGCSLHIRLEEIFRAVEGVIDRHNPECLAVEQVFFSRNARSALVVGQARGVVLLAAARRGMEVMEYTPLQVKMAVVGHGSAIKAQVQAMVKAILGIEALPKPDDVADALAVGICCLHTEETERRMGRR